MESGAHGSGVPFLGRATFDGRLCRLLRRFQAVEPLPAVQVCADCHAARHQRLDVCIIGPNTLRYVS